LAIPKSTMYFNINESKSFPLSNLNFLFTYEQFAYDNNNFIEKYPYNITACSKKCFLFMKNYRKSYLDAEKNDNNIVHKKRKINTQHNKTIITQYHFVLLFFNKN